MKNILKLSHYLKSERKRFILVTIFSCLTAGIGAALPIMFRNIIDALTNITTNPSNYSGIVWLLIILAGLFLASQILLFFNEKVSDTMRMTMLTNLRMIMFPHLLALSVDYTERHRSGTVLQRVNQGMGDFFNWLWSLSEWLMSLIIQTIIILVILWIKVPLVGLAFTLILPVMAAITFKKVKLSKPYRERANKAYERQAGYMGEAVSNLSTIKSLSAEKEAISIYKKYVYNILNNRLVQFKYDRWYNMFRDSLGSIVIFAAVVYATYEAIKGRFTPGDVFLIAFYARDLVNSAQPISRFINDTADVEVTTKRLVTLLETKPTVQDTPGAKHLDKLESVEFRDVSFTYPGSEKGAVHNLSFTISPGKTMALVGPSGVGKSTITKLLLRYYVPTRGQILVNGEDISVFTQDSVRAHIGMVMQDVALFNASINENLSIANTKASPAKLQQAARQAHAEEFIAELPKGYQTLVGERGIRLSGGQKQRVAIARAILKNPQLIILDEATSALDSESERLVQDGLHKLMHNRSAVVIAHRLSTVMHADEIVVLERGHIVERGEHKYLIAKRGLYAKLFEMQSATGKVEL